MATYQITEVRTEKPYGATHEHITHVKLSGDSNLWPRNVIIEDITRRGYSFYTYGAGTKADVIVAGCPHCGQGEYITTEPDSTTANNLLSLPRC